MDRATPDRLRFLIDTIIDALDERIDGDALAKRAYLSRFHFDRLVASGLGEAPAAFRRRLLLERAAWQLQTSSVTDAGLSAGYGSTEAFTRAFARTYGMPPSRFVVEQRSFRLSAPNGVHFHPPAGLHISGTTRKATMDLTDRLLEHDAWLTEQLFDSASTLSEANLDKEIRSGNVVDRFVGPEPSVRALLTQHVFLKEVWIAAIDGTKFPEQPDGSLKGLRIRHETSARRFREIARNIHDRGEWDDAFVDALCEPPQSFTYGSVVAHIVEHSAHRRGMIATALRELGVGNVESTCAIDWEKKAIG
jgi:AraC family transcriptional regulator